MIAIALGLLLLGGEDAPAPIKDPNETRLLFAPTGRPLPAGSGYFSDHFVVFPGLTYGLTDHLSIGGGMSFVPGIEADEQLFFLAPRLAKQFTPDFAASAGVLFARGADTNGGVQVAFSMATFGEPDASATVGLGVARSTRTEWRPEGDSWTPYRQAQHAPILVVGGTRRMSRRTALVSENWLVLNRDFRLSRQPVALAVRLMGESLSADVGLVVVGELIDEGLPLPWLSVTYQFGRKR